MSRTPKISDDRKQLNPLKPTALDPLPEQPVVSILISSYNYGAYLGDAIESALQQTYDKLEVVICDDGSTDGSPCILEKYRSLDQRIRVVYQANGGQSLALNAAFRKSTGDIICLLDADDVFMRDKVRRVVDAFGAAPGAGLAVNRMLIVDKDRKCLGEIPLLSHLATGWQESSLNISGPRVLPGLPPSSGLSLRRVIAESIFPLPSGLRAYADTLIQVLAPRITPIVAIQTPSSEYRVHGANVAAVSAFTEERLRNLVAWEREIWRAWRRHFLSPSAPSLDTAVSETTPTLMAYAYARFRSDPGSKAVYQAIHPDCFRALPSLFRWYWRTSPLMPNWLFRKSFAFAYGQTRAKRVVARILSSSRSDLRARKRLFERIECTRHRLSNTTRDDGLNETAVQGHSTTVGLREIARRKGRIR
jgi:glycosyltransferase involved in cell wall biosynthesis